MKNTKLTLYVDEEVRVRVKVAASYNRCSISDFLMPAIEQLLLTSEQKIREGLAGGTGTPQGIPTPPATQS